MGYRTRSLGAITPRAILVASGDALCEFGDLMRRRLDELADGQVLEVISRDPTLCADIPEWCARIGHELLAANETSPDVHFWIKKVSSKSAEGGWANLAVQAGPRATHRSA